MCGLVCPSRTGERGGKGDCLKDGGGEEGEGACIGGATTQQLRYGLMAVVRSSGERSLCLIVDAVDVGLEKQEQLRHGSMALGPSVVSLNIYSMILDSENSGRGSLRNRAVLQDL
jgi:hypothetical protein